jgi:diguanylate cyclase (GGDEF)-like protein
VRRTVENHRAIDDYIVALGHATAHGDVIPVVLRHCEQLLAAETARIVVDDGAELLSWTHSGSGAVALPFDAADRRLLAEALAAEGDVVATRLDGGAHGMVAARRDGAETLMLVVGRRRDFDQRTRTQFASVFAHAGVALQNMRLVTRLQEKAQALERLATHDPLTGLANRMRFREVAGQALAREALAAVFLIDLDRFKEVNDTLGHHIGDQLLCEVADRLRRSIGRSGLIARLGGDEFAVLLLDDSAPPIERAERLHADLERPADLGEVEVDVGASVGVALPGGLPGVDPEGDGGIGMLLRHADVAMYEAKSRREGVRAYTEESDHYRPESLALVPRFRNAIERGELGVAFQPQFDLRTEAIVGAEALVRWSLPGIGPVPPDEFVPIAESTGLIRPLTRHVLVEAVEQCARWSAAGHRLRVSVNIAPRVLLEHGFVDGVTNLLRLADIPPELLRLEVTETSVMSDPERSVSVLRNLRDRGISIAIDDFGTGHSSLAYLTTLPCHELKIDRSFIVALENDPRAEAVVAAIIGLGHDLGLEVVAEGVETSQAAHQLAQLGCRHVQGYRYGRPMRGVEFDRFLAARTTAPPLSTPLA